MVRRASAQNLGRFAEHVEPDLIGRELIPLFQDLTKDGERHTVVMTLLERSSVIKLTAVLGRRPGRVHTCQ